MIRRWGAITAFTTALLAGACQYVPALPSLPSFAAAPLCAAADLRVDTDFATGGQHRCVVSPEGLVVIQVDHEPTIAEGINPSPWYAFRLNANAPREVTIALDYTDYTHRYVPWVRTDTTEWRQLDASRVTLNERKTRATLRLDLPQGVTWVAGQPLSNANDNVDWTRRALAGSGFSEMEYGKSLEGRSLVGFVGGGGIQAIVVLTRQHPPETSGQEAYRGFIERLVSRSDANAVSFRGRHRTIIAPMPNPDGVDNGHWRLNAGGLDLNRDWGKFTQPETKALSEWIIAQSGGRRVVSMMDFHSTDRTVIYAPPLDAPSPTIAFLPFLESAFKQKLTQPPEWSYAHNVNGGTSKGWALETLKAPGITVELWDQIPAADARKLGAAAADALIDYFAR